MKDQWDYVLNVLEELGDKQLFLKYQCSTDISFLLLLLLSSIISNDRQTSAVRVEIDSEENSLSSRIELLRRLLVVLFESVEEDLITFFEISYAEREKNLLVQYQSTFFHSLEWCSVNHQVLLLCGFAFAFDLAAKSFIFCCDACSSGRSAGTSVLLWFESITNLFDPWEILTQDWELSSLRDQILISIPCLPYRQLVVTSSTGPNFCVSLDPSSLVVMIHRLLEECIHDKPSQRIVLQYP